MRSHYRADKQHEKLARAEALSEGDKTWNKTDTHRNSGHSAAGNKNRGGKRLTKTPPFLAMPTVNPNTSWSIPGRISTTTQSQKLESIVVISMSKSTKACQRMSARAIPVRSGRYSGHSSKKNAVLYISPYIPYSSGAVCAYRSQHRQPYRAASESRYSSFF